VADLLSAETLDAKMALKPKKKCTLQQFNRAESENTYQFYVDINIA
jgi:hypothetical protein